MCSGNNGEVDHDALPAETVDQTLLTSAQRVRSSRQLLEEIDARLARGAELLDGDPDVIDLRTPPAE